MANINGTAGNDILLGTAGDDTINGLAGADNLTGGDGADILLGGTENDLLEGGDGNDTLNGNAGIDVAIGGDGNDIYVVNTPLDQVIELPGEGVDEVRSSTHYTLGNYVENLTLLGAININGTGNISANTITGNSGNNRLNGGQGADALIGGLGNDTFVIDDAGDTITENAAEGTDSIESSVTRTIDANVENIRLLGVSDIDATGNAAANILIGNAGSNILDGGAGADIMTGGGGNDVYIVDNVADVVTELASQGSDTIQSSLTTTLGANVENLVLLGIADLDGTGNAVNNSMNGNAGSNSLTGGDGNDTLSGGAGNDTLNGGAGADVMVGGTGVDVYVVTDTLDRITELVGEGVDVVQTSLSYRLGDNLENLFLIGNGNTAGTGNDADNILFGNIGNNRLDGRRGADDMTGNAGNDTYVVDNVGDLVHENAAEGTDTVESSVTFVLGANVENLRLIGIGDISAGGNAGDNVITGNAGSNIIDGGLGADRAAGGAGDDTYIIGDVGDVVIEAANAGNDTVQTAASMGPLAANVENLTLTGGANINGVGNTLNNIMVGNTGANVLSGADGNDSLFGGAGNDRLVGGAGNDTMRGGAGADLINGLSGADNAQGGEGDDIYVVDNAGDSAVELAGEGTDRVQGTVSLNLSTQFLNIENAILLGTANLNAVGNASTNILIGNSGNNILNGAGGDDDMRGGLGNDTYVVNTAGDLVTDTGGVDRVNSTVTYTLGTGIESLALIGPAAIDGTGNASNNTIGGNANNNRLDGGAGNDSLVGAGGDDTYVVDSAGDRTIEALGAGNDSVESSVSWTLAANIENLTLTGGANINGNGNTLDNTLTGNTGSNVLNGGAGADTMTGGLGNDTYFVDNAGDVINENPGEGNDTVRSNLSVDLGTQYANVENVILLAAAAIDATGNAANNQLVGNVAANTLTGGAGNDLLNGLGGADTLVGGTNDDIYVVDNIGDTVTELVGEGTDRVQGAININLMTQFANVEHAILLGTANLNAVGNASTNILIGNSGNNILNGAGGDDDMRGGLGNDTYVVNTAGDLVTDTGGVDRVNSTVTYTLGTGLESLALIGPAAIDGTGNASNNTIGGNANNNRLDGGAGNDRLVGAGGDDTYVVDSAGDLTIEALGAGSDTVESSISWTLAENVEDLLLTGGANINGTGNTLDNTLTGNTGNNVLNGGAGADVLAGGAGNDSLAGGADDDIFLFNTAPNATTNMDRIFDFGNGVDSIHLDDVIFAALGAAGSLDPDFFITGTVALDGDDFLIYDNTTGNLFYDADGNGVGAQIRFAQFLGLPALDSENFTIV